MDTRTLGVLLGKLGPLALRLATAQTEAEKAAALQQLGAALEALPPEQRQAMEAAMGLGPAATEALGFAAGQAAARGEAPAFREALGVVGAARGERGTPLVEVFTAEARKRGGS